jgi:hypothetical protein
MRRAGQRGTVGEKRDAYRILDGNLKRREFVDWLHLAHDRGQWYDPVNAIMNLRFHNRRRIS